MWDETRPSSSPRRILFKEGPRQKKVIVQKDMLVISGTTLRVPFIKKKTANWGRSVLSSIRKRLEEERNRRNKIILW